MKIKGLLLVTIAALLVNTGCVQVLSAQSFPLQIHAEWTPNIAADEVTNYVVVLNNTPFNVLPNTCTATVCKSPDVAVTSAGPVTVSVTATNKWGNAAEASITVVISVPGRSQNVKITK